jgi:hypothetical protein
VGSSFNEPGRFRRLSGWRFCRSHLAAAQSSYRSWSCSEFLFVEEHRCVICVAGPPRGAAMHP